MKKQLLLCLAMGVTFGTSAQRIYTSTGQIVQKADNKTEKWTNTLTDFYQPSSFQTFVNKLQPKSRSTGDRAYSSTIIGKTIYDLQSNGSVCNSVVLNADGTIGAVWTMSHDATPTAGTPDRGTGYNYFNGTAWGTAPLTRLENDRCGWPNLGVTKSGAEIVINHQANANPSDLNVMTRPAKGTGAWTQTKMGILDTWPRMVVGGQQRNTIHIISQTSGTANPPFKGQNGALAYSRSLDGGATWDKKRTIIPQIDSSFYLGFGGDAYSIDAKGDTIAIVVGGEFTDVVLLKSINNGNTWTKTIVKKFPIPLYDINTMISDTNNDATADYIETNDGFFSVLLDNSGKAHVWYGNMVVIDNTAAGTTYSYIPKTDGLMYWNENKGTAPAEMIASVMDLNGNDSLDANTFGKYGAGMCSMPSAGIDAQGTIYVSYGAVYEGIDDGGTVGGSKSYRHTYVMRSDDGGATWCNPQDVTDPEGPTHQDYMEGVFGSMARKVNGFVHLIQQVDPAPGHALLTTDPDVQSGNESEIVYVKIPVADVACNVGIKEKSIAVSKVNLYPNPATTSATLSFVVTKGVKVDVSIYNAIGQKTAHFSNDLNIAGTHTLDINTANYKAGIYFVNSTIDGQLFSQKLVIQ